MSQLQYTTSGKILKRCLAPLLPDSSQAARLYILNKGAVPCHILQDRFQPPILYGSLGVAEASHMYMAVV